MAYYFIATAIDSDRGSAVTKLEYLVTTAAIKVTNTWAATFHS